MLDKKVLEQLENYINLHLNSIEFQIVKSSDSIQYDSFEESLFHNEIEEFIKTKRQPILQDVLFSFIDRTGLKDPDIYKKAGVDRKLFSKIRSSANYRPSKNTIISLALALELNQKETDKLLGSAGYSLSDSDMSDLVIQFCLEKKIYDLLQVNEALDYFSLKPLGGMV
jgi:hypothetical protein